MTKNKSMTLKLRATNNPSGKSVYPPGTDATMRVEDLNALLKEKTKTFLVEGPLVFIGRNPYRLLSFEANNHKYTAKLRGQNFSVLQIEFEVIAA
ncbi:MAG: hypothetical protein HLUCCO02_11150 [Idiomarinaceae bacterium HL-53]|nr:MAG: hypothetical protein HLUCCO02_11150 [Idiomarinaceae bacterium HL-53]CUS47642.1 hypothetical protein Ga0003345_0575 [Idiomarinaceae bacterium HL-53]